MRFAAILFASIFALAAGATTMSPEAEWKASLADANVGWAKAHYAVLKIQDAVYMRDGDTSTLVGIKGKPESYKWVKGTKAAAVLIAGVRAGHPFVVLNKQLYADNQIAKGIPVDTDIDIRGARTQVAAGVIGARIMVFNQQAKAARDFPGVDFYSYDPAFRVVATFKQDPARASRVFRTSRGTDKQFFHAGDATFVLRGKTIMLPLYAEDQKKVEGMSAFFIDEMTGRETYGAGRYVDVEPFGAFPPKTVTIDFNDAYNPNCARSPFFTCPVATDVVALAVKAGERDPHKAH
ncbi:MAG: DUF1684 domain-containing protein [Rhizomicrobium sp.]